MRKLQVKHRIGNLLRNMGYDVRPSKKTPGIDPFWDMSYFMKAERYPIIFDVGGNLGQTVDSLKRSFPTSSIYTFEPSPSTFNLLKRHCERLPRVHACNYGVGSKEGKLPFFENKYKDMSSFLHPGELAWGRLESTSEVDVVTLDAFTERNDIEYIHILKSDTQGYDFEVLKGAERLMRQNKIGLIYFEFIFSDMYKHLPPFDEVFRFLIDRGFVLTTFYKQHFQRDLISWFDVMFINAEFNRRRLNSSTASE